MASSAPPASSLYSSPVVSPAVTRSHPLEWLPMGGAGRAPQEGRCASRGLLPTPLGSLVRGHTSKAGDPTSESSTSSPPPGGRRGQPWGQGGSRVAEISHQSVLFVGGRAGAAPLGLTGPLGSLCQPWPARSAVPPGTPEWRCRGRGRVALACRSLLLWPVAPQPLPRPMSPQNSSAPLAEDMDPEVSPCPHVRSFPSPPPDPQG